MTSSGARYRAASRAKSNPRAVISAEHHASAAGNREAMLARGQRQVPARAVLTLIFAAQANQISVQTHCNGSLTALVVDLGRGRSGPLLSGTARAETHSLGGERE